MRVPSTNASLLIASLLIASLLIASLLRPKPADYSLRRGRHPPLQLSGDDNRREHTWVAVTHRADRCRALPQVADPSTARPCRQSEHEAARVSSCLWQRVFVPLPRARTASTASATTLLTGVRSATASSRRSAVTSNAPSPAAEARWTMPNAATRCRAAPAWFPKAGRRV